MSLFETEYELKIPFNDLDPMNIVWHGNYIKYMEQARCDMFDKLNYTYYDMKDDNYAYPIAKMNTKYISPLSFNQAIIVKVFLEEVEPAIRIKYNIFDKLSGDKVFEAETMQIAVDIKSRQSLYEAPKRLLEKLGIKNEK
jgi:acyl-CoA thioester hydrolase